MLDYCIKNKIAFIAHGGEWPACACAMCGALRGHARNVWRAAGARPSGGTGPCPRRSPRLGQLPRTTRAARRARICRVDIGRLRRCTPCKSAAWAPPASWLRQIREP